MQWVWGSVWDGVESCGGCKEQGRYPGQRPSIIEREFGYLAMWNNRDPGIGVPEGGPTDSYCPYPSDRRDRRANQMIWPGCQQFMGTHAQCDESTWIGFEEAPSGFDREINQVLDVHHSSHEAIVSPRIVKPRLG